MTEDEAKTKWCPFSLTGLLAGTAGVAVNRSVDINGGEYDITAQTRCLASGCAVWKLTFLPTTDKGKKVGEYGECGLTHR